MRSCSKYDEIRQLAFFDELGRAEKKEWAAHIETCPGCRREQEELSGLMTMIQSSAPPARLSPYAAARMRASIIEKAVPHSFLGQCRQWLMSVRLVPVMTAACLVVLIWGGIAGYDAWFQNASPKIALHDTEKQVLMENYEVINNLDILEEMEFLEKLVQVTDSDGHSTGRFQDRNNQVRQDDHPQRRMA